MHKLARFTAPDDGVLDATMQTAFQCDGFLILEDFVSNTDCNALIEQANKLVDEFDPVQNTSIFSAREHSHAEDDYFKTSGDKICFFFEPDAFDHNGQLRQDKNLSINKIGHALHDLDPVFDQFSRMPKLAALADALSFKQPLLLQSMYIFKQPHIGGEVNCHQDSTFLHTEPLSCVGFWFALQDASTENGCLYAIPGRHPLKKRFLYQGKDELVTETWDDSLWPLQDAIPLEAKKGTLIALHGLLPHLSGPNHSARSRHAYTLHLIDGDCDYSADNWLRRSEQMPLRGFNPYP